MSGFYPIILAWREFEQAVRSGPSQRIALSVEQEDGLAETVFMDIFPDGCRDEDSFRMAERVLKTMLWSCGGDRITVAGSAGLYERICRQYAPGAPRSFDREFMAIHFQKPFQIRFLEDPSDAPGTRRASKPVGRHLDGCRIGFDAGGSDRKVSAVIDGECVYSEETVWFPKLHADPGYQYAGILDSLRSAAAHLPRVDAIGVSSAGTFRNNLIRHSSLFRMVPRGLFEEKVSTMYLDAARTFGDVPVEVANDGDVTALAGAMELNADRVLGIAMGTSEAGGYVDGSGNLTGWLNELAFVPVDLSPDAPVDEWSGDTGVGAKYFSQDGVIRLAEEAGIAFDADMSPAEKLKRVQALMREGDPAVRGIYEALGRWFGYSLAWYARFYEIRHVLILGRVTSGEGGEILLRAAQGVLDSEFPSLSSTIRLHLPDEADRRVGQSIAAASLPEIKR